MDIHSLSVEQLPMIFSHSAGGLLILVIVSFDVQKPFSLDAVPFAHCCSYFLGN
jgi:hypothetical protein